MGGLAIKSFQLVLCNILRVFYCRLQRSVEGVGLKIHWIDQERRLSFTDLLKTYFGYQLKMLLLYYYYIFFVFCEGSKNKIDRRGGEGVGVKIKSLRLIFLWSLLIFLIAEEFFNPQLGVGGGAHNILTSQKTDNILVKNSCWVDKTCCQFLKLFL